MAALDTAQRQALRDALVQQRRNLVTEIRDELARSGETHFADLAGRVHDAGDESVARVLADLDAARVHQEVTELRETEAALARLDGGGYGTCMDCGEPIAYARLVAYPTAQRCIGCQSRHEKGYAHENTPRL